MASIDNTNAVILRCERLRASKDEDA